VKAAATATTLTDADQAELPPDTDTDTDININIDRLYTRLARPVLALAYQLTGDAHLAEDVLQETFLAAHKHAHTFKGNSAPETWIYRIAVNAANRARRKHARTITIIDRLRRRARDSTRDHRAPHPQPANTRVRRAIDQLPEDQRNAILMLSIREIPAATIAETLGIPTNTVYSRAHAARRKLRQLLDNQSPN